MDGIVLVRTDATAVSRAEETEVTAAASSLRLSAICIVRMLLSSSVLNIQSERDEMADGAVMAAAAIANT